ncbi:MAG: rRNA maturation RNase YbeY [Planctomycetaceae bacterium]|nr:rRNA maturation RNase YbeY [Planctomycetaceae bacterium]
MFVELDILNQQTKVDIDIDRLRQAAMAVLQAENVASAVLSITVVDNPAIHVINRDHLNHDYPTDVISFQLEFTSDADLPLEDDSEDEWFEDEDLESDLVEEADSGATTDADEEQEDSEEPSTSGLGTSSRAEGCQIEGEVIVSAEYADQMAGEGGWTAMDELTLYVVHGILHICGYDDLTTDEKTIMRQREVAVMKSLGLVPRYAANDLEDTSK